MRKFSWLYWLLVILGDQGSLAAQTINPYYSPPFEKGKKFLVAQGFMGSKTHFSAPNRYAVDLVMPEGEPVCAAEAGKVVDLYDGRGWFSTDSRNSNYVHILDASGRVNDYQHLLPGSIHVQLGQAVQTGECFAKVGNTGSSSGPHLHFAVLVEQAGELVSVPFEFVDPEGRLYTPQYLQWVRN